MRRGLRHGLKRPPHHLFRSFVVELAVDVRAGQIRQPSHSTFDKSFPPLTHHTQVGCHFARHLCVALSRCAEQDDARLKRQRLRRWSTASVPLQLGPLPSRDF
jgi:hypothetical protein